MADGELAAVPDGIAKATPRAGNSNSFCIRLFRHMRIESSGEPRVCCAYHGDNITHDGVLMSINTHSVMEIWNSDTMRGLRRDMIEGRSIPGCKQCYADEARGGVSMRTRDNEAWEQGFLNEERATIDQVAALAVDNDFRLPAAPEMIEVETGNLCNLKCRMCNGDLSSLISKDIVHRTWANDQAGHYHEPNAEPGPYRFRRAEAITSLDAELVKDSDGQIKRIYFIGGEPLLVREVREMIQRLVAAGQASHIALAITSNGTVVPPWLSLASQFRHVDLAISVDGYAEHYEYIRYPGRWSNLVRNLQTLNEIPNLHPRVTSTIQANNALNITQLFRYLDAAGIGFTGYLLHWPRYLAIGALPSSIRRVGAARLIEYAEGDCRPENRPLILSLATQFDSGDDSVDPGLIRDLMLFTNDLDASRGQSIHRTDPEFVELLAEAGYPWVYETLHAPEASQAQELDRWRHALMDARSATSKLEQELAHAHAALEDVKRVRNELADQVRQSGDRSSRSEEEAIRARRELEQVYASHSWRLTSPYRRTKRALGHVLRGSKG